MSLTDTKNNAATDSHHDETSPATIKAIFAVLAVALVAWGAAIAIFGVPGLYIPALCLVPLIYVIMILAAKG